MDVQIPNTEWMHEPSEAVGLAALDLASPAGIQPSSFNELEDSPLRTQSNPLDNLARFVCPPFPCPLRLTPARALTRDTFYGTVWGRSARFLSSAPSKTGGGDGDELIGRRASLPLNPSLGLRRPPQQAMPSHLAHSASSVSVDSVRLSSDTDSIKLDTEELSMFNTVYQEVDTLWYVYGL